MLEMLVKYILSSLVQRKGRNITWINWLNTGIDSVVSGAQFTKNQLRLWKHFLTASREGDAKVRAGIYLNMFLKVGLMLFNILLWYVLSKWFFTEFDPFSYMDVNGHFWEAIVVIGTPMALYAFFCGQLDWFGSNDAHEDGTVMAESLPLKWLVSIEAGVTEEFNHRSLLIFVGLISVYLSNAFLPWIIVALAVCLCVFILAKFEVPFLISGPVFLFSFIVVLKMKAYIPENVIYQINGYIFALFLWLASDISTLAISIGLSMAVCLGITVAVCRAKENYSMSIVEFFTRVLSFSAWSTYCIPLGIGAIAHMPILPENSDHWTYLLYVGAILWSNAKFRDGHKYQGPSGMLNSYVIGIYMFYVAFTHGLIYAIVLHVMFDAVLFTSEHLCQVIKNRRMVVLS